MNLQHVFCPNEACADKWVGGKWAAAGIPPDIIQFLQWAAEHADAFRVAETI